MPYTRQKLDALANPISAQQPEALPWCFYDSRAYAAGGAAGPIQDTYFQIVQVNKAVGNIPQPGALPTPQYFQVFYIGLDVQLIAADSVIAAAPAVATGPLNDMNNLLMVTNTRAVLTISGKPYMEVPLSFLHGSGGATGLMSGVGAATNYFNLANNSTPGAQATWCTMGAVIIPPNQAFDLTFYWFAAVTPVNAVALRPYMIGSYYRRVL